MSTDEEQGSVVDRAIGGRVEWLMKRAAGKRHTQMELAAHLRLDQSTVSKKLRGQRPFTVRELYSVAEWLERPVGDIFADREQLGEPPILAPRTRRASTTRVSSRSNPGSIRLTRRLRAHPRLHHDALAA